MDFELGKKSGQIPAFGDWDNANDLPITQYFESARQAGLLRYAPPNSAATTHLHHHNQCCDGSFISSSTAGGCAAVGGGNGYYCNDFCAADFQKPQLRVVHVPNYPRKVVHGGGVNNSHSNGDDGWRRRGGCPRHLREEQQRIKEAHDVGDLKHQNHHNHHQQQQRTRRSSSSTSQQLFRSSTDQIKKQFPKHSAIVDIHKPPLPTATSATTNNVKPVDEDLYKIPPELLLHHHSKRKKMLGFFSKCLVPPCSA